MHIRHTYPVRYHYLLIGIFILTLSGCGTARHISKSATGRSAYTALGLNKERKDNTALYVEAASWLGVPHRNGGTSRKGTDCSFLVYSIYQTVYGKNLERNSASMWSKNCISISKSHLQEGDLVFFSTGNKNKAYVNHVGIYLKENKFVHASTSKGVIVSDLNEPYYLKTWVSGGRVR